ncbi:NAD(P)-dependent dehydrogenase (short-subunit alcohol dehydrogenase family) [Amycolatopsis bartoniae]|uniref:Oxidoreductase n=1 Tax=Amycolatopsis bartoniae TaxID=941986 RepID=A0A8H9IWN1_9PSEU|nr:SDR family oxidoreductase [Amycolatopsis bartoniae]MBB2939574.1 NAD(P)-dependent dehydrogenase (short-subunit alcohol dehydrogenase family) [Amycolatopsis bartoniae]TVT07786.1 SDR family oxidoreductase [Amycolatopsis bartoniae]GHF39314.1 oxidoreductase [Amycolatopsis bartoniae]
MSNAFHDKVAVVTGGSAGIGFATAHEIAGAGGTVYITGRDRDRLSAAASRIPGDVVGVPADSSSAEDLGRLFTQVRQRSGRLDVLVTNAAAIGTAPLGEITREIVTTTFDVNVTGTIMTVQQALPLLADGGAVVLTGSMAAHKASRGRSVYAASKAAVRALARTWALELTPRGIRVNVVSPGPTDTPAIARLAGDAEQRGAFFAKMGEGTPMTRAGTAEEVAAVIAFVASDAASHVNGADYQVDGGYGQV